MRPKPAHAVALGEMGLVRCLGERGIPCVVVARDKDHLAFASRYCLKSIVVPSFDPDCRETLDLLLIVGKELGRSLLFCNGEPDFQFVSKNRSVLSPYFILNLPSEKQADLLVDKGLFYKMAAEYGLPIPKTWQPRDPCEMESILPRLPFPCVLKPTQQSFWKEAAFQKRYGEGIKALRAETPRALRSLYRELWGWRPEILIQEYIPGRDDQIYFFDTYFDARSEPLGYFIGRRIRTFPMGCGVSSMAETARHPEIARVALSALRRIRYRGAAHIDFKIDGRDRSPRLLEINPRFGLAIDLGARAGVNLPAMAYDSLLNRPVPPSDAYSTGIKWIDVKQDIKAFLQYRAAEEWKATDWVRSFLGPKMFRIWSPRDPWPFIISLGRFFRRRLQQPFKSLERKGSPLMAPPSRPRDAPRGGDPPVKGSPRRTEPDNRLQSTPPRN